VNKEEEANRYKERFSKALDNLDLIELLDITRDLIDQAGGKIMLIVANPKEEVKIYRTNITDELIREQWLRELLEIEENEGTEEIN
jgi:hypothetical protein